MDLLNIYPNLCLPRLPALPKLKRQKLHFPDSFEDEFGQELDSNLSQVGREILILLVQIYQNTRAPEPAMMEPASWPLDFGPGDVFLNWQSRRWHPDPRLTAKVTWPQSQQWTNFPIVLKSLFLCRARVRCSFDSSSWRTSWCLLLQYFPWFCKHTYSLCEISFCLK